MWIVAIWLSACTQEQIAYSHYEPVPGTTWSADLPVRFSPEWSDSAATCRLLLDVRHTQRYPHGNLPIVVDLIGDDGRMTRHRVHMPITDGRGNWLGQGFGTLYQCQSVVADGVTCSQARRVVVWLALDSCDSVTGVSDIGITLIKN